MFLGWRRAGSIRGGGPDRIRYGPPDTFDPLGCLWRVPRAVAMRRPHTPDALPFPL
jgi:hypothetical protein